MKTLLRALLVIVLAFVPTLLWMLGHEDDYIFFPEKEIQANPHDVNLPFRDIEFTAADGTRLHGWYMHQPRAGFTLLAMHGNAGNISDRLAQYRRWYSMGLSVFAFDYRGYGRSEGEPSEAGLYEDARAAWQWLQSEGVKGEEIIIAGRSLGAAVATHLATEVMPAAVAIEVPFTSLPDMSAELYPWLPVHWLMKSDFDIAANVAKIHVPLLLVSAESDEVIPHGMAEQIFEAAHNPKQHAILAGGHNDFDMISARQYQFIWHRWLKELSKLRADPPVLLIRYDPETDFHGGARESFALL